MYCNLCTTLKISYLIFNKARKGKRKKGKEGGKEGRKEGRKEDMI